MKSILVSTAALAAAVAILAAIALPPARLTLLTSASDGTVPGILHVHSRRSDGRGTPETIAEAAARAGLKFVVLTDHGDATRRPDPPTYRFGVLCLDGVEISSIGGHYLALGMPAAPYPLGGEARDVVEDVRRLGGWGIVAHPESPKPTLQWSAWEAPFDGIEWVNPDTSWRVRVRQTEWRRRWDVVEALASYPFRSPETMARLIGGTTLSAERWNWLAERRRVVVLAGADAHARLGFGSSDPGESGISLPVPGYEASFRTLSVHVQPERPLTGEAAADAAAILQALRRGHAYVAVDGLASPPTFQFTGTNGRDRAVAGDELAGPATLKVASNAPPSFTTTLWAGSRAVASARSQEDLTYQAGAAGVYRVEISAPSPQGPIPWIISNPIYVSVSFAQGSSPLPTPPASAFPLFDGQTVSGWWTENDATSVAGLEVAATAAGRALQLRYSLSGGAASGQFVALAVGAPAGEPYKRVAFSVYGERPGRLEVQVRRPAPSGERWQRSVYFDQSERAYTVDFTDMAPIGSAAPAQRPSDVRAVLFVLDTTHTAPGSSGRLWIGSPVLER